MFKVICVLISFKVIKIRKKMKSTCFLVIFICAYFFAGCTDGARILGIFPVAAPSHFAMYEVVLKALADRGHQVDVVSHFPLTIPHGNYTDVIDMRGKTGIMVDTLSIDVIESMGRDNLEEYGTVMCGNEVCKSLGSPEIQSLINNPPNDPPYDLVLIEFFFASCYFAFGRHLKVPVVAISSSPSLHYSNEPLGNPMNTAIVQEHRDGSIFGMSFWQRLKNTIHTTNVIYRIRRITEAQNEMVKNYFGPEMPDVRELERDVSLLLVNTHFTLNGVRPITPAVVEVGGIHVRDDVTELPLELKKWLDNSENGFIYISFGSLLKIETLPKDTIAELYTAFEKLAPLRILMKANNLEEKYPGLPTNVMTSKWLPQVQVLKHKNIRGFVTHGGMGGVQEAVIFGVPFIGLPVFADQPRVVKSGVDMGVAVSLDYQDLTADKFLAAVNAIINDPKYKKNMISLSQRFRDRPLNPKDTATFWIEYILKFGGDSLRSPSVKLAWWQLALLDVWGSIIIGVLVMLYLIKLLVFRLIRTVSRASERQTSQKRD